jgi:hypothetical protein
MSRGGSLGVCPEHQGNLVERAGDNTSWPRHSRGTENFKMRETAETEYRWRPPRVTKNWEAVRKTKRMSVWL